MSGVCVFSEYIYALRSNNRMQMYIYIMPGLCFEERFAFCMAFSVISCISEQLCLHTAAVQISTSEVNLPY